MWWGFALKCRRFGDSCVGACGADLVASQYMVLGAKARALLYGRSHANFDDVRALAHPVLRHRILINYRAEADGVNVGNLIDRLLKSIRENVTK